MIKVNREKFLKKLRTVEPALGVSDLVPELERIQFDGSTITATDGLMAIRTTYEEPLDLKCRLPGMPLIELLSRLSDETIKLERKQGKKKDDGTPAVDKLQVRTSKVEGSFAVYPYGKDITLQEVDPEDCTPVAGTGLVEGLSFCRFCVSKDKSSEYSGINVQNKYIYATDRMRMARYELNTPLFNGDTSVSVVFPVKFANALVKLGEELSAVKLLSPEIFGARLQDGTAVVSALLPDVFPSVAQCFDFDYKFLSVVFDDSIADVLDRHLTFSKDVKSGEKELNVQVDPDAKVCVLTTSIPGLGTLQEDVPIISTITAPISFKVNPMFLGQVIKKCSNFQYCPEHDVIMFHPDNLMYLVKPK